MRRRGRRTNAIDTPAFPRLIGFPYLMTRVEPGVYHLTMVPAHLGDVALVALARDHAQSRGQEACLVLAERTAVHVTQDGRARLTHTPPDGAPTRTSELRSAG